MASPRPDQRFLSTYPRSLLSLTRPPSSLSIESGGQDPVLSAIWQHFSRIALLTYLGVITSLLSSLRDYQLHSMSDKLLFGHLICGLVLFVANEEWIDILVQFAAAGIKSLLMVSRKIMGTYIITQTAMIEWWIKNITVIQREYLESVLSIFVGLLQDWIVELFRKYLERSETGRWTYFTIRSTEVDVKANEEHGTSERETRTMEPESSAPYQDQITQSDINPPNSLKRNLSSLTRSTESLEAAPIVSHATHVTTRSSLLLYPSLNNPPATTTSPTVHPVIDLALPDRMAFLRTCLQPISYSVIQETAVSSMLSQSAPTTPGPSQPSAEPDRTDNPFSKSQTIDAVLAKFAFKSNSSTPVRLQNKSTCSKIRDISDTEDLRHTDIPGLDRNRTSNNPKPTCPTCNIPYFTTSAVTDVIEAPVRLPCKAGCVMGYECAINLFEDGGRTTCEMCGEKIIKEEAVA